MLKKKKNKNLSKLIKVIIYLIFLIIVFCIAPNYEKSEEYCIENKLNLIIDNKNVTKNLKYDLFANNKEVIYISIGDISSYFDSSAIYDEENKQIITTYREKVVKLPIDKNYIYINNRKQDVLSGAVEKDGMYYIPITAMEKIYEVDIDYINNIYEEEILLVDSLTKKLVKADVSKNCNIKYKTTIYSKTVDKLEKADKVIVIEHLENHWTKIRTNNGKIGYIKTKILQNEIHVREDLIL